MSVLRELLELAVARGASDLHLKADQTAVLRISSELVGVEKLSGETLAGVVREIMPPHLADRYEKDHEADFALVEPGVGRFRINVFCSKGEPALALRYVKGRIPTFQELNLPPVLDKVAGTMNGIVLACGATGSGKSTTLAAMIQVINLAQKARIITVEDPIEYVFSDEQSVISQREVGLDTQSFRAALRHVIRQDPDVIMIGEMRDAESFMAAVASAETGHLILTTLHTATATQSVTRILDFFPVEEREAIRMSLSRNLRAVMCQRLVPALKGGVVPALEILINTPTVRKLLEDQIEKLDVAIETGREDGMQSFNQALYDLCRARVVSKTVALQYATNPEALRMNLDGIFLDESRRIMST